MGELAILDDTGDTKYIWDVDNEDEIQAARDTFNALKRKRYLAYKVNKKGEKGEIIHEFDPNLGKIILCPPVVGG